MALSEDKQDIQAFWGALYDSLHGDGAQDITREQLVKGLDALEDMFRLRRHMAVVEMPLDGLKGNRVLEIGPGAGGHSALFAHPGAIVTARDTTHARADAPHAEAGHKSQLGSQAPGQTTCTGTCVQITRRQQRVTVYATFLGTKRMTWMVFVVCTDLQIVYGTFLTRFSVTMWHTL